MKTTRRDFLKSAAFTAGSGTVLSLFPPSIRRALAIPANTKTGSIRDIEHVVILMQENRSFDHYFGGLAGVRGFADRFPIPVPDAPGITNRSVWTQLNDAQPDHALVLRPFHLNTLRRFELMRVEDTPHTWSNTQDAWAEGRMNRWPVSKTNHSMAYFKEEDAPFQYALANAFTVCDAYHCSFFGGTNTNRLFLWTGTNDPESRGNGPAIGNTYNTLTGGDPHGGYTWTTYPERLERAGVSWRIYQNMADNYALNPLAGFKAYRDAFHDLPDSSAALKQKALTTRELDLLRQDVLENKLPQIAWICPTREGSEHPTPSSPAQGANYTARVLDALTANPGVWAKTVLLLMYDENDGFFDHMPPPAPPSYLHYDADPARADLAGASTVDTRGEYHEHVLNVESDDFSRYLHRPYGLGPRVPMVVISPWTKGGWVNSQVFDHTSVLQFLEKRFGVHEPNISAWRRAVCGDLTSAFNFENPNQSNLIAGLPATADRAARAAALGGRSTPTPPATPQALRQASAIRPARALPYALHTHARVTPGTVVLAFDNVGPAAAVFHVYDRLHLQQPPRRYTVEAGKSLHGRWQCEQDAGYYDLWVLGPNGFHRHFAGASGSSGAAVAPDIELAYTPEGDVQLALGSGSGRACTFTLSANAYTTPRPQKVHVAAAVMQTLTLPTHVQHGWYDYSVEIDELPGFLRRVAGRVETGKPSVSDPAAAHSDTPALQARIERTPALSPKR